MRRLSMLAMTAALVAVGVAPVRADVVRSFALSGTFADGSALSGSVRIDTTTGAGVSAKVFIGAPAGLVLDTVGSLNQGGSLQLTKGFGNLPDAFLNFVATTLVGFGGGALQGTGAATPSVYFVSPEGNGVDLVSGSATLANVPEPATLPLLAAGMVAAALGGRRRRAA